MMAADRTQRGKLALVGPELDHAFAFLLGGQLDGGHRVGRLDLAPALETVRSEDEKAKGWQHITSS